MPNFNILLFETASLMVLKRALTYTAYGQSQEHDKFEGSNLNKVDVSPAQMPCLRPEL